ncbi:MAG TPA: sulfite exporter TauE/SafE family protein [Thermoleophilaceae bacterium]
MAAPGLSRPETSGGHARGVRELPRPVVLGALGLVVGTYSGLFGIGAGAFIIPALVLWFSYGEHEAAATSLAANCLVTATGAAIAAAYGAVDVAVALLVAVPAAGSAVAGATLQQRVPQRVLAGALSFVFVAVAFGLVL